jgi:hypothetical protein
MDHWNMKDFLAPNAARSTNLRIATGRAAREEGKPFVMSNQLLGGSVAFAKQAKGRHAGFLTAYSLM